MSAGWGAQSKLIGYQLKRVEATEADYRALISGEPPPLKSVLTILQAKAHTYVEEIEYANSIIEDAGTYLSFCGGFWHFIRAEMETEFTAADVDLQKEYLERLRNLLPEILRLLEVEQSDRAGIVLHIVHDACSEYDYVRAQGRREANRKRLTKKFERLRDHVRELCELLDDPDLDWGLGFEHTHRRYRARVHGEKEEVRPFWKLKHELQVLSWHLELETHRAKTKPETIRVPDNQAKTHLVDTAYSLSLYNGHPTFVTTPGSDFGYLCSLLHEVATGSKDESLAGAINRFARSTARQELDQHEIDHGEDNARARDADNFFDVKENAVRAEERARELMEELGEAQLSKEARMLIFNEIEECIEHVENQHMIHGPFLVWASQMKIDWEARLKEMEESTVAEREENIAHGKRRRSENKST
ncbi:MAG: hypothetical protein JJ920_04905 [Roseitalea sp.]|nr:hypothetical protein [Roseitalea sp.]MBO6721286.1 hypothetical protein [Roseitalea sp.]MBO6742229.1 hypothetical protein [Roseitalea sp.]